MIIRWIYCFRLRLCPWDGLHIKEDDLREVQNRAWYKGRDMALSAAYCTTDVCEAREKIKALNSPYVECSE